MSKWHVDCDQGEHLEELISLLMGNRWIQLGVNDTPEGSLLLRPCHVHAVQEGDVENYLGIVSTMVAHFLVLEVRVLNIATLLEL